MNVFKRECSNVRGVCILDRGSKRMVIYLPIVCEFCEVFPYDISDLPSEREVVVDLKHLVRVMF